MLASMTTRLRTGLPWRLLRCRQRRCARPRLPGFWSQVGRPKGGADYRPDRTGPRKVRRRSHRQDDASAHPARGCRGRSSEFRARISSCHAGAGSAPAEFSPEAWACFLTAIRDAGPHFPLTQAWRDVRDVARKRDWPCPLDIPLLGTHRTHPEIAAPEARHPVLWPDRQ